MADVHTVQGPVDSGELGTVLIHEHVRFRDEAVADEWPDRYDERRRTGGRAGGRRGRQGSGA